MSEKDGGHAFPTENISGFDTPGMTLRDWFAGQALAGVLAHVVGTTESDAIRFASLAAYRIADAMLAKRAK
jgi:Na+/proline symporter